MTPGAHPYLDHGLAAALAQGSGALMVQHVAAWDGAPMLVREVPGGGGQDASGCYPMLPFAPHWDARAGAAELSDRGLVSAVFVTDPVLPPPDPQAFDHARPFKTHHLVDLAAGSYRPSAHHAQEIRRAKGRAVIEEVDFAAYLPTWSSLYGQLAAERGFSGGVQDFGAAYFTALARAGVRAWLAQSAGVPVAMALWLRHGPVAYYHLAAGSAEGRKVSAAYGLVDAAIRCLSADGVATIVLGGAAGGVDAPDSGLARFKAGFANATATTMVCGLVLDHRRYHALATAAAPGNAWFPSYRAPRPAAATLAAPTHPLPADEARTLRIPAPAD